ncbi:MAG: hypothetical protein NC347_14765 [Clostridium sp.]|nr:hypothetical protein [Clostridium sp.]
MVQCNCRIKKDFVRSSYIEKKVGIIKDADGKSIVVINDLRFKGRRSVDWNVAYDCLKEYAHSKDTKTLRGANMYAKANSVSVIIEMIEIATNKTFVENCAQKHNTDVKFGWYWYDTHFAIPVYDDNMELVKYNVFLAKMLVRHAKDGKLYLYDVLRTKKETSKPLEQ